MGVAALVLGIVSIIISFIPFCSVIVFIPAVVGLILGIVDTVKKSKNKEPKGMSIAGLVLSAIAIVVIILPWFAVGAAAGTTANELNDILTDVNYYY